MTQPDKEIPVINSEVDIPFDAHAFKDTSLPKTSDLDSALTKFKYVTGKQVLYISMAGMSIAAIVSVFLSVHAIENDILDNLFEVFKLIAMTVLGYIFGSNSQNTSH